MKFAFAGIALALACLAGCSSNGAAEHGTVEGTVTIAGKPLSKGSISFENPQTGVSLMSNLGPDGSFRLQNVDGPGLPAGLYQVAISPSAISSGETPLAGTAAPAATEPAATVPEKYRSAATSGLTADVKAGDNPKFEFNLVP
jgi:hypothetical protein